MRRRRHYTRASPPQNVSGIRAWRRNSRRDSRSWTRADQGAKKPGTARPSLCLFLPFFGNLLGRGVQKVEHRLVLQSAAERPDIVEHDYRVVLRIVEPHPAAASCHALDVFLLADHPA